MAKYILALDQGTTSSRSVIINESGEIIEIDQQEFSQIFPQSGWVEHNAEEILTTQLSTLKNVIQKANIHPNEIAGIGITNQRETTVVWDKNTGKPIYNAIVWQDKRTANICESLKEKGLENHVRKTTGLVIDSYFSATKINWVLNNVKGAKIEAEKGNLLFGTIDTWLLWNLTKGKVHATDYSNASRTMLYDIKNLCWDNQLLQELDIPNSMLPEVKPSSFHFGNYELEGHQIPVAGIAGDQQAALFGQACFHKGEAKNTYGTGCFMLMNTGENLEFSKNGLLTTIAWGIDNKINYALEGSVFVAGSAIQWLRDGLQIINNAKESEVFAKSIEDENPVYVVPAFAGLGAPYWDMYARGAVFGLTRDTGKNHLIKATLDALAYQTKDILDVMQKDSAIELTSLKVDGGACANNYLMQFQSDILNTKVERPEIIETTVMGAAYLAGICVGLWKQEDILNRRKINNVFSPNFTLEKRERLYKKWQKAVERTKDWID
ncbi:MULTISPECIES: glycerol kinase GlpK [unclassified Tenacibaculum]|uniref:glycerol kinase GlpK n=1 Tax=unclassified Tenacibaculum TaxID=2635139 RepID=UPI001F2E5B97|nr:MULTISPECIES: glycerol kinase GlpK [unclassified Tenacibaculum]MCF2874741.1 glycerol kinase GlpK [Tenacibaculum sp. Cn5-1]MCF2934193.1 glycerol kinase GlpK [Tenacibaculum sp. Cn5-34]MCG7510403.1 glycerol kinase GlpK [Tenacibaculum sp. Cn5-46]